MQPTTTVIPWQPGTIMPDHTQLPETDGSIVENFQEHPQGMLLTGSLRLRLRELHPDGQYAIGHDSGIYWRFTQPPLDGCKAPDWFYVPGVPPMLNGQYRRSYVLWQEAVRPLLVVEYVSGDGREEHDATPYYGKFWVYEQAICAAYYAIFDSAKASVELFKLNGGRYHPVSPNKAGRLPVEPLRVELGIWLGLYQGMDLPWLRVWDAATGTLLPCLEERAESAESLVDDTRRRLEEETERAETERKEKEKETERAGTERKEKEKETERAETERKEKEKETERANKLAEKLRTLGIDPDAA